MGVYPEGHVHGAVARQVLDLLDVKPRLKQPGHIGVPLWHNKDKSENPCVATGWLVCPYSFSTKNGPQMGSAGGVKNQGCT